MIRIQDCLNKGNKYKIYLTEETYTKVRSSGLHNGILITAASRVLAHFRTGIVIYFYSEHNIVFTIEIKEEQEVVFSSLKKLNVFDNKYLFTNKEKINPITNPVFLKSYEDGRKVFLNEGLPIQLSKLRIPPHYIALRNLNLPTGEHSMYMNGIVIDFVHNKYGDYYITNIVKPDLINFGLAILQN